MVFSFILLFKTNDSLKQALKHFKVSVIRHCSIDLRFLNLINEAEDRLEIAYIYKDNWFVKKKHKSSR